MTIALYGRGLANQAGIGRYTRELIRSMLSQPRDHEFRLFAGPGVPDSAAEGIKLISLGGNGARIPEEQIHLARSLKALRPDVFHNPDFTLPLRMPRAVKAVVTVHDVAYLRLPKSNSFKSKALLSLLVPWSVKRADAIVSVSEFSKREIVDAYKVAPSKVHVIPNGVDPRFHPPTPEQMRMVKEKYKLPSGNLVLYVGGVEDRKNLLRLALALESLPQCTLAIAGGKNRGGEQIMAKCRELLGARLLELGFFPDENLPALYGSATVFAYPSIYEGFGIPPLEAMACGCVTASSNATAVPEAVGDASILFDPLDVSSIRSAIQTGLEDAPLRESLVEKGLARAREFNWQRVGKMTLDLYESL